MRTFAQLAFLFVVSVLLVNWKSAIFLPLLWPLLFVAVAPIAWYALFNLPRDFADALTDAIVAAADRITPASTNTTPSN